MDTKYKNYTGMGDIATLAAMSDLFSDFGPFADEEPEANPDYMETLGSRLVELNMVIACLLSGLEKGIPTKKVLDMNINRIGTIANDIVLAHKINDELSSQHTSQKTEPEEATPQN